MKEGVKGSDCDIITLLFTSAKDVMKEGVKGEVILF